MKIYIGTKTANANSVSRMRRDVLRFWACAKTGRVSIEPLACESQGYRVGCVFHCLSKSTEKFGGLHHKGVKIAYKAFSGANSQFSYSFIAILYLLTVSLFTICVFTTMIR